MQMMMSLQPPVEQVPTQSDTSSEPAAAEAQETTANHVPTGVKESVPYMVVCVGSGTSCMLVRLQFNLKETFCARYVCFGY